MVCQDEHGWHWMVPPPPSKKVLITANPEERKIARRTIKQAQTSMSERLLKGMIICFKVMGSRIFYVNPFDLDEYFL